MNASQKEALFKLAPLSVTISDWISAKCKFLGKEGYMFPSIILADLLHESDYLNWPLSKDFYSIGYNKNNKEVLRYANNITRIESNSDWSGKEIELDGIKYKSYRDWMHFASDYSDTLCFTDTYDRMLKCNNILKQIELYSKFKKQPLVYQAKIETLIQFYYLREVDE